MKRINTLIGTLLAIGSAPFSPGVPRRPLRKLGLDMAAGELLVLPPRPTKKQLIEAKKAKQLAKGKVEA